MSNATTTSKKKTGKAVLHLPYWVREFAQIRLAVACTIASVSLGVAAVLASDWYRDEADSYLVQSRQARNVALSSLLHVEAEKRDIRTYQPQFIALRNKGLIGEENRLAWLDAIRQVQEERKLLPLTYEIDPQQPLTTSKPMGMGEYLLRGSRMRLHLDLLHEMDLFNFISDLQERSFFGVEECAIKRLSGASNLPNALTPMLSANCTFNWLTLTPASVMQAPLKRKGKL
jgi:hypothetical protein